MAETANTPAAEPTMADLTAKLNGVAETVVALAKTVDERSKPIAPWAFGFGRAPGAVIGESSLSSRPFSFARLAKGLLSIKGQLGSDEREDAKTELEYSYRLAKSMGVAGYAVPLDSRMLVDQGEAEKQGDKYVGLAKEWKQMNTNLQSLDQDEYQYIAKQLTAGVQTTGGSFIPGPAQGEIIDLLRAQALFGGAIRGMREVTLPPQGSIEFPRVTSGVTISAYAESDATSESTPGTGDVKLEAKMYSGMVQMSQNFLKFATTVSGDAFVRTQLTLDTDLKIDRDIINGTGGKFIKGLLGYSNLTSLTASTTSPSGDTLGSSDIDFLIAKMADASVPTNSGVFIAMTNVLMAALKHRKDSNNRFLFDVAAMAFGGGTVMQLFSGKPIYGSPQIPRNRGKGAATNLTSVLVGIPSELYIGRAGAMVIDMTDSHASNFAEGKIAMRSTTYVDAVPAHEQSFGVIDQLVES